MSGSGRTIYIAGAGIAGLTLALALAKFGATVVLLERNKRIQEVGAGLQISPNARRVLNQLGLDRQLQARAFEPSGIDLYPFRARRPLMTLALGRAVAERFGAPYAVMHRADLADLLYKACKRFANIEVLFGVRAFDVVGHARGISVLVDEAGGTARSARAFAFIGADGVHSHTRVGVLGGPEAVYTGAVAWRTTLPLSALDRQIAADKVTLLMAPGYHAVCYPLPYRKQVNIALFAKLKASAAFGADPPRSPQLPWALLRSRHFDALMAAAEGAWNFWPLSTVTAESWHSGGTGLVGDAAHAMLPFQAQGAAMAIEDAAILAPLLMTEPTAESALARYEAIRRPRVERVQKLSAANATAFHMEWPFTLARNAVIALQGPTGHFWRLDWLYGFDAAPEPDILPPPQAVRQP
ncbi:MAG TPA: monooxygenase [Alphaproteobacteria bacterium]|nr:monooxygenase [Alphaproteobacteria bacterium]